MMDSAINAVVEGEAIDGVRVALAEGEGEDLFVGMVLPADAEMRMAGLVEPFVEEGLQVLAADGFHDLLEIGA
jgi:hypothetical protein